MIAQLLTRHSVTIAHNAQLFAKIRSLWDERDTLGLDDAQQRLLHDCYRSFADGGAALESCGKARFAKIAEELSALSTRFGQNVLAAVSEWKMLLDYPDLDGLPDSMRAAASRRAETMGYTGGGL